MGSCINIIYFHCAIKSCWSRLFLQSLPNDQKNQVNLIKKCLKTKDDKKFLSYFGKMTEMSNHKCNQDNGIYIW